jgi:hypothetical protein
MLTAIGQGVINELVFAMVVLFEKEAYFLISFWLIELLQHFFFFVLHLFAVHVILEI